MKNKFKLFSVISLLSLISVGCSNSNSSSSSNISSSNIVISSSSEVSSSSSMEKPTRPHTHKYGEWEIIKEATLFEKGERSKKCNSCDDTIKESYYDLSEVAFNDRILQYNGKEQKIVIEGLLPKDVSVRYENNTRKEEGTSLAKAIILDKDMNVIETKEAALTIIPYRGLAKVDINTLNGAAINSKEVYTTMNLSISNCESTYEISNVAGGIRLRGNGTLEATKKPYRIKFDKKQNVLGLNDGAKCKSWVLLAEYYDYSMMRNATAFTLGQNIFDNKGYYSSDFEHVNVYINGIFNGIYVLAEQQQVDENRVDIYEVEDNEEELNIGYLFEMDNYADENFFDISTPNFSCKDSNESTQTLPTRSYSIKSDIYSLEQRDYAKKYLTNVYSILYYAVVENIYYTLDENNDLIESNYKDAYETINAVIDIDSLIRSYILEEIMKDIDVGFSSYYLFVDLSNESKFKKLTFGAPWDFDWSSGNVNGDFYYRTNNSYNSVFFDHMNPWLLLISKLVNFKSLTKDYWNLMTNSGIFDYVVNQIEYMGITYKNDFDRNFQKWNVLGTSQHTYHSSEVYSINSHAKACELYKNWLNNRITYLNSIWG